MGGGYQQQYYGGGDGGMWMEQQSLAHQHHKHRDSLPILKPPSSTSASAAYYGGGDGGMWMEQQSQTHQHHKHRGSLPILKPPSSTSASAYYGGATSGGGGGFAMHQHQSFQDTAAYGSPGHHHHGGYGGPIPGGFNKLNSSGGYDNYYDTEEVADYDRSGYMEQSYGGHGRGMTMMKHEDEMRMRTEIHDYGFNNPNQHHHDNFNIPSKPQYPNFQHNYYWAQKGV